MAEEVPLSKRYHSPAWDRVRRRVSTFASEWAANREAERKKKDEEIQQREKRIEPWVDRVGQHVEQQLNENKGIIIGDRVVIDIPLAFFADLAEGDREALRSRFICEHNCDVEWKRGQSTMRLLLPVKAEPVIARAPYLHEAGFVAEGTALTHVWMFIGTTRHGIFDEILEFDPSTAAKGKDILWLVREASKRYKLTELLIALQILREGDINDDRVSNAIKEGLMPEAAREWTEADHGKWASHSITSDSFGEPFLFFTSS
jgi:hypothetical protein